MRRCFYHTDLGQNAVFYKWCHPKSDFRLWQATYFSTKSPVVWEPRRKLIAHQCCCQNRGSADQYHMTVPRAQVSTHRRRVFFEVICWQTTSFKWSQAQVYFFQWFIWNMLCLCHYGPALLRFWFQTDLGRENLASFSKIQARKTFSYHGYALVTLYVQCLCSDWSEFDRWVHAENLCSILKVVYFDSWSWQSFVSTCDVFNCLSPLDVQNENTAAAFIFEKSKPREAGLK